MIRYAIAALCLLVAATGLARDTRAEPPHDAILILDASGSMWGQIEGVNKIVIARDVVEGLVRGLPAARRLGLVAYGHRREGDCGDIETLAEVGAERAALIEQVRALSPRGKTPLSGSILHAARALDYTRQAAEIILVSDGLENCGVDPCALARELEANGLDLTVHVVGFDVTQEERAGLLCVAEETGGRFLAADDAASLGDALAEVATAIPAQAEPAEAAPVPSSVILKATVLEGGPLIQSDLDWRVVPAAGGDPVFTADDAGVAETALLPGDYRAEAVWRGWQGGAPKRGGLDITIRPQNIHVFTVPVDLALPVTLDAPASVPEGQEITIGWSGPDALGAVLGIARPDDPPATAIFFFDPRKHEGGRAALPAPPVPGDYELRYALGNPPLILARRALTVTDSAYGLTAPEEAPVSTPVEIGWNGAPTPGDLITIVPKGDPRPFDNGRYRPLSAGEPVTLTTPSEPGEYEIRYVMYGGYTTYEGMQHAVQATRALTVTATTARVEAPAAATGGDTIEIAWSGPAEGLSDDYISIVEPGGMKRNRDAWAPVARGGKALNPAPIRVPDIAGAYEVVYFLMPGHEPLARAALSVTAATASLDAPATAKAGEDLRVRYTGEGFAKDRIVIVKADHPDEKMWGVTLNYGFKPEPGGGEGMIRGRLLAEPGEYEIRYVTGLQNLVLARAPLTVTE